MIVIHIEVAARPDLVSFLEIALAEVTSLVTEQEGCLRYQWLRVPGAPTDFVVYGEFASHEAFAKYQQSPAVRKIEMELIPLLAGLPRFKHLDARVISEG